ncbi:hypothetical protein GCM10009836_41830 [Pseudonocardia ailaonensis]|uniref:Uncharacterized protein n=1 Tax=Pseudonocardia ailaonensis TaxID=367279 RepID=A0ABN2N8V5_9PSEU
MLPACSARTPPGRPACGVVTIAAAAPDRVSPLIRVPAAGPAPRRTEPRRRGPASGVTLDNAFHGPPDDRPHRRRAEPSRAPGDRIEQ